MEAKEIIRLANECGVGDKDLSDDETVVTDYGDSTAAVLRFAALIEAAWRDAGAKVRDNEIERLRAVLNRIVTRSPDGGVAIRLTDDALNAAAEYMTGDERLIACCK